MTSQILEQIKTLSSILADQIRRYDRMEVVVKFMQAKKEHPDYRKNQLCALVGVSDSYIKKVMKDLDIKSFYRHDIPVNIKKKKKPQELKSKALESQALRSSSDFVSKKGRKKAKESVE